MTQTQKFERESKKLLGKIIAYETGELSEKQVINLFQNLINSGLAWQLQGHYGRTAAALIKAGYCKSK